MKLPSLTKPRRFITNREFKIFPGNIPHGSLFTECNEEDWKHYISKWKTIFPDEDVISDNWIVGRFRNNRKLYMIHKKNFARIS